MEDRVHIGLLGPLQLHVDGRPVSVQGKRRKAILALLAAGAGRTVTVGALLDEAFYDVDDPAPNTLHVHVSQLRSLLAPYGAALERQGGGYRLDDAVVSTDASGLDRALQSVRRRPTPESLRQLRSAVDAWRGDFCADVPVPALEGRRAFHSDLRLSACEVLFDAELAGGGSPELPERIEHLLAGAPLRERLWGQLMLALNVAGRQSEALAAYRRARTVLADEGGLDPGPALRELEAMILRQADSVDSIAPVLPASTAPTLVWLDASGTLQARPLLEATPLVIGRSADCGIRLDWDPLVSRRHATIARTPEGFAVNDLGSTNGVVVDGVEVHDRALLKLGGTLQIGDTVLFLRAPSRRTGSPQHTVTARRSEL
ncbi:BTAD domain-containing putative transcriptional regulator [Kineosporia succinea]|uniref:DNA-binding SARP family transcriptional activator n=1 Tax=Kineosporia succinea TaxID=84632 RepID=A0ABT9P8D0_9ACTN|nr:BTAD domain-containing putative transcriptional regulator [Kineosporia succinea]MDP9828689.1 DNA-binding SARP family transcriptional activator [Kineosporia succinea]